MKQIAVYGKGGIGKSTISSNLSAALAVRGRKVLQIGCDPKHDSTRLLCGGHKITTVLDYIKDTPPDKWSLGDIVFRGFKSISCVEAGGPKPGVGCAGRGILTTFDLLEKLDVKSMGHDYIIYDVLGDVVCGGFAVPIRREYSDTVYIITSGEYMSVYAANNILRGIKNYDHDKKRVGGIIFNKRGISGEQERVFEFGNAVRLPVVMTFERSEEFTEAERKGLPLAGLDGTAMGERFLDLADIIIDNTLLYAAQPVSDEELEEAVLGGVSHHVSPISTDSAEIPEPAKPEDNVIPKKSFYSKNVLMREPLHGCAYNGAVNMTIQVGDAVTVSHGPRSCAHISMQTITSTGRRVLFERGIVMPNHLCPPLVSSEMNEGVMVFGGIDELRKKVSEVILSKPSAVFVATTCPSGIIGDDAETVSDMSTPEIPVIPLMTDGNLTGDYLQGMIISGISVARGLVDRSVRPEGKCVNIVAEKAIAGNTEDNFRVIKGLLEDAGIGINCRYLCRTSSADIRNFLKAEVSILANDDYFGRIMRDFFTDEFGASFFDKPFPVGFEETGKWLRGIASLFNSEDSVDGIIKEQEILYEKGMEQVKPVLRGKRLMVIAYNHDIDWILETAVKLEMDIVKVCILNYSQEYIFRTRYEKRFDVVENYDPGKRINDIDALRPDLLVTNYNSEEMSGSAVTDTIPLCPDVGFLSGLALARRWAGLFKMNLREGWKDDRELFSEYYA